jgi:ubiquinone/menaquinone biosynthesis C-methylase UbiE
MTTTEMPEFFLRLTDMYRGGALTLMIDVGHKTGLFEAAAQGPATSAELAERAGLQERYVREWLGSVTTGGIMQYEPATQTYTLPAEHAFFLTGNSSMNMAVLASMLSHLGKHVNSVVEAFSTGGGVPYSEFRPEFTSVMDEMGRRRYDELLVGGYLPVAEGLVERLESGARVADVGCGTGHCLNLMAAAFPQSTFVGFDIAEDAIELARKEAESLGLDNVTFEVADAAALQLEAPFDVLFAFDAIHDQVDPAAVLANIRRGLADDGLFFMVDIKASSNLEENLDHPFAPVMYATSTLHCMTVSLAHHGAGLGNMWGRQVAERMLHDAGFENVEVHDLELDPVNYVYVARP